MTEYQFKIEKQCLMVLYNKKTGNSEYIYGVQNDNHGYPLFLIMDNNQWIWKSAKHYITREQRLNTFYTEFEKEHGVFL